MRLFAQLAFAGILGLLVRNANASGQDKDKKKADAFEKTPVDWYGDPLPANAMARLGTTRWRHVGKGPYRTEVAALAFSPDGKTVASLGYNSVCLWERGTGRRLGEFETAPYGDGPQLTFSADSSRLRVTDQSGLRASYVRFNEVRFNEGRALERSRWRTDPDGSPGAKWARSVPGLTRRARTPEGRSYVTQEDYLVVQRDRETDRYMRAFGPLRETVRSLAISPKGKLACLLRREVVLFDIATGKEAGRISVPMHYPLALAFSPDGQTLAVGHTNGYIRMVDLKNVSAPTRITGHQTPVLALAFAPNGKWLASVSSDSLRLWDMTTGEEQRVLPGSVFGFTAMALSPDGKIMATGHERVIELWDTDTWKRIEQFPVAIPVDVLAFSPDGKTLLSNIGQVDIGKERKYRLGEGVWSNIAYSADGGTVAKTSRKGHGPFLFRPDGTKIHSFHIDLLGGPFALAPLGTSVAGATRDSTGLALYEAATGRVRRSFDTRSSVDAVAFSADARRLAGSARGVISVWDTASPTTLYEFTGHEAAITSLAFSPDGKVLASGSMDSTVLLWEIKPGTPAQARKPVQVEKDTLDTLWAGLADDWDTAEAYRAMERLIDTGDQAVKLFRARLPDVAAELKPRVQTERSTALPPVVRIRRVGDAYVLTSSYPPRPAAYLRFVRALEVLEFIGTDEAYRLVRELSRDPATRVVAREALAASVRMAKQRQTR